MIVKNVEKNENNTATFQVEVEAAEFEKAVQAAYLKNKGDIYIPGFRKGKAPRAVVEGMYGPEVFYKDAMDDLAPGAFEYGVKESELKIVGSPAINDVNVTDEKTVLYTFGVDLYPEVKLGQYKGLEAVRDAVEVSDERLADELDTQRRRNARKVGVERAAQMGDTANIDFDGYLNGERFDGGKAEGFDLKLGSNAFVPGFEEQIVGMQIGEEKDLDITFPEQYVEDLAGKAVVFKVKLNSLSIEELPELDDEFAKDVSEFDTLEEYKADLRKELEKQAQESADAQVKASVMKQAVDNLEAVIPTSMIAEKAEEIIRNYAANFGMTDRSVPMDQLVEMLGIDKDTMDMNIRPGAEFQVKQELLVEAVVKAENIEATDEEAEEYLKRAAESVGVEPDQLRNYFGMDFIKEECKKEKASNLILDSAVITDAPAQENKEE